MTTMELEVVDSYIDQWIRQIQHDVQVDRNELVHQINLFEQQIRQHGLNHKQIIKIVHILLTASHFDEYVGKQLARALLPRGTVPKRVVLEIIGSLGRNKNYALLTRLFKWIIDIFHLIDDPLIIGQLYGVLFHYLDYESLRPYLCHLLYMVTRKDHIQPHRIRRLYQLQQRVGQELPLLGLLSVFQDYRLQVQSNVSPPTKYFKPSDSQWLSWLANVQRHNTDAPSQASKLPSSLTSLLASHELPPQLSVLLTNRSNLHGLSCLADESALRRLHLILEQTLMDLHLRSAPNADIRRQFGALLSQAVQLAQITHENMPVFESFLAMYLKTWNGHDFAASIFSLLTTLYPRAYNEMHALYLRPLLKLFTCGSPTFKATLLTVYSDLLTYWARLDWSAHYHVTRSKEMRHRRLFKQLIRSVDYFSLMRSMGEHCMMLSAIALQLEHDHVVVQHAVLRLCERTSQHDLPFIVLPPIGVVYRLFFSDHVMPISRVAGLLTDYKVRFDKIKGLGEESVSFGTYVNRSFPSGLHLLKFYRGYVTDISNGIWKNQGWTFKGEESAECFNRQLMRTNPQLMQSVGDWFKEVNYVFSLTHSSAMGCLAVRYLQTRREYQLSSVKQLTSALFTSVKFKEQFNMELKDFRVAFLNFLKDREVQGLHRLLYTFMQSLAEAQKQPL